MRADLISQVLQPGRFSSPENGLTFHIRDRSLNGDLLGLLVHDERDDKQVMSYLAERGRIITNDEGSYLVMLDGYVHRYNSEDKDKNVQIVAFDQNMLDLSEFAPKDTTGKDVRPREMYFSDLISPDMNDKSDTAGSPARSARSSTIAWPRPSTPSSSPSSPSPCWATRAPRARAAGGRFSWLSASRWAQGCRANGRQSGGPQPVGRRACVWNSAGGDCRCGMGGAR